MASVNGPKARSTTDPPRERRILWGAPHGWAVPGEWLDWVCRWADHSKIPVSMPQWAGHPGRVDLARSWLIDISKANRQYSELWTFDTDVWFHDAPCSGGCDHPIMSADRVAEIVQEDFDRGWDVIHAPVMSAHGPASWGFESTRQFGANVYDGTSTFAVAWTTGAFLAFRREAIDWIEPNGEIQSQDGKVSKLYCRHTPTTTEDVDLGENLRKCGLRLGVDPRLLAAHGKVWRTYIDPAWWRAFAGEAAKIRETPARVESRMEAGK